MTHILEETIETTRVITLNRIDKHNAFDENIILKLTHAFFKVSQEPNIHSIILKANGKHFCAGADLAWMRRMLNYNEQENLNDAKQLAILLATISQCPKPTIALVQGAAMGGGAGLVAACDFAIAEPDAFFAFSEVKMGLIPAVISPYVVQTIGPKLSKQFFISAERITADQALTIHLIYQIVAKHDLLETGLKLAESISHNAPEAISLCKKLIDDIYGKPIDDSLQQLTAQSIAKCRVSQEAQTGLTAFLNKTPAPWSKT